VRLGGWVTNREGTPLALYSSETFGSGVVAAKPPEVRPTPGV
jgi:hypothetical protein